MWKSRSRRNQVTFYNIFDSWSVLYFKIMTYKSSLSRILWRRSVLSLTLPSYQTQAGAEYLPVIVPSTESLPVSKPLQWSSLSSSVKPLKWPKVSLSGKLQQTSTQDFLPTESSTARKRQRSPGDGGGLPVLKLRGTAIGWTSSEESVDSLPPAKRKSRRRRV